MRLASWRGGAVREALLSFVDAADALPVEQRVAVFDNDGTLWCEKPNYVQLEFMVDELRRAVGADPTLAERDEYRVLLEHDRSAQSEMGLERIAFALLELCVGIEPTEFDPAAAGNQAPGQHSQGRCLPCPIRTEQTDDLSRFDSKRQVLDRADRPKVTCEAIGHDRRSG
mgnify:CR=1 FL=1